jgi:hypothetical protein
MPIDLSKGRRSPTLTCSSPIAEHFEVSLDNLMRDEREV